MLFPFIETSTNLNGYPFTLNVLNLRKAILQLQILYFFFGFEIGLTDCVCCFAYLRYIQNCWSQSLEKLYLNYGYSEGEILSMHMRNHSRASPVTLDRNNCNLYILKRTAYA